MRLRTAVDTEGPAVFSSIMGPERTCWSWGRPRTPGTERPSSSEKGNTAMTFRGFSPAGKTFVEFLCCYGL